MSDQPTKRKLLPWPWYRRPWREIVWGLDLDDGTGDGSASLTKILALLAAVVAFVAILREKSVSGTQVTLIVVAISAAFGRGIWKLWLTRGTWSATATTTTTRTEQVIREEIANRRAQGAEDGTEPT
jgi:hypothetical protein